MSLMGFNMGGTGQSQAQPASVEITDTLAVIEVVIEEQTIEIEIDEQLLEIENEQL